ncbi:endo-1,4-beta-xylanase [Gilvimarinus xylanilyticus]|uniref:Beta-xylanase n=1 Tax=Gilvimarinus xylanilyticus TaxID=2944139 RepID=A0A9X2KWU6_9GAMM|nr:endo-1,4-beta-xylanase [Gilvimarinus xylanilyticus]MCP8899460.1 endo-1,4-beta-xylanase [Gilvimarinus xylanilyticus]
MKTNLHHITLLGVVAALTACGGGSGGGDTPPPASSSSSSSVVSSSSSSSSSSVESSSSSSSVSSEGPIAIEPDFDLYATTPTDFPVGVAVSAANENYSIFNHSDASARQDVITRHFSQLTAGNIMKMSYLHPQEDTFTFGDADQLVGFAETNGMTVHGHALVWHSSYQVPGFMNNYDGDFAAMLTDHVTNVVQHFETEYPGVVTSWDVVNEAVDQGAGDGFRRSVFYNELPPATDGDIPEYLKVAFQAARDAAPDVDLYYNDYDNTANETRLNKTLQIAEALNEEGTIDGVGFQMHIYMGYPSLSHFENAFQQVVDMGLKVKLTEIDVSVVNPYGSNPPAQPEYDEQLANDQKQRFCQVAEVYLDTVPAEQRGGFTVWGLTDDESWLMNQFANSTGADYDDVWPLLFNADLSAKPALQGVADAFTGQGCN